MRLSIATLLALPILFNPAVLVAQTSVDPKRYIQDRMQECKLGTFDWGSLPQGTHRIRISKCIGPDQTTYIFDLNEIEISRETNKLSLVCRDNNGKCISKTIKTKKGSSKVELTETKQHSITLEFCGLEERNFGVSYAERNAEAVQAAFAAMLRKP